jgi:non-canonical (house-cleaning) NTP pyrophosphatase
MKAANIIQGEGKLGEREGYIHIATNGRMDRTAYNKYAIMMALVHLEHPEYF